MAFLSEAAKIHAFVKMIRLFEMMKPIKLLSFLENELAFATARQKQPFRQRAGLHDDYRARTGNLPMIEPR